MDSLIPHKLNLSIPQLKKLLKGHSVQLSRELIGSGIGDKEIHLNKKNANKLMRAYNNSKGMRITLSPDEIAVSGGNIIKTSKGGAKSLITAGVNRAVRAIDGSGISETRDKMITNAMRYGGNVIKTSKGGAKSLITAGVNRAVRAINGGNIIKTSKGGAKSLITAGVNRAVRAIDGSGVNRLKKATRWEGFANKTGRDAIDMGAKAGRAYYNTMNPMEQMGFGVNRLKKATRWEGFANKTGRDAIDMGAKAGRAYYNTMSPMEQMGFGLYGYGAMRPAVMPPGYGLSKVPPKLGKGVATRSRVYRTAMRRNMGVDIDNAAIAKPPGGRYNSLVKPASRVMTMSPYQGTNSPAMHPFVPMTAYQNSGVSYNIR